MLALQVSRPGRGPGGGGGGAGQGRGPGRRPPPAAGLAVRGGERGRRG